MCVCKILLSEIRFALTGTLYGCTVTSTIMNKNRQAKLLKQEEIGNIFNWNISSAMHPFPHESLSSSAPKNIASSVDYHLARHTISPTIA